MHRHSVKPSFWSGQNQSSLRTGTQGSIAPGRLSQGPVWSWHDEGNGTVRARPLIDGDSNIYLTTVQGDIYKLDSFGQVQWTYKANASIPCTPALLGGTLFAATEDGRVFALDSWSGRSLWAKTVAERMARDAWSMMADGDVVVVAAQEPTSQVPGSSADCILALSAADGSRKWVFRPEATVISFLPAVKDGSLVFCDEFGRAYRVELRDGREIWRTGRLESASVSSGGAVIGPDGVVYVTGNALGQGRVRGQVSALSFTTGSLLWRQHLELPSNNPPAVGRLGGKGSSPYSVVLGIGVSPGAILLPSLARADEQKPGKVLALDATTGSRLWTYDLPAWQGAAAGDAFVRACWPSAVGTPAIGGDGTVYAGYQSGRIYAIHDSNGDNEVQEELDEVSSYPTGAAFQGSPGIASGMLVAAPCDGVHVFKWL